MNQLTAINSNDRDWTSNRYVLAFGAYGWTKLLVWANSLEDALEECADWCADNAPGLLCDNEVAEEYERALSAAKMDPELDDEERQNIAWEESIVDTIVCDNNHYFLAWEVHIVCENPTRAQLLELTGNPEKERSKRVGKAKLTGRPFPKHKSSRILLTSVSY